MSNIEKGTRFGKLVVTGRAGVKHNYVTFYTTCDCGAEKYEVPGTWLRRGLTVKCPDCKGTKVGDIWWTWFSKHVLQRCKATGYIKAQVVEITIEYAWNLFVEQKGKCKLSGLDIKFPSTSEGKDGTASLDRIDSSKGYIEGNVQWVHKHVNMMKNRLEQNYFISLCRAISNQIV